MIKSVHDYSIDDLIKKDANYYYVIPKYQREYTWTQQNWKDLYDDFMENNIGYFFGSIICINNTNDACEKQQLEVVDGQQRLTTVCLLLAAIYTKLKAHKELLDEENLDEMTSLKKALLCPDSSNHLIFVPQVQSYNDKDFLQVMFESGIAAKGCKVAYMANRRIYRCYRYFLERIEQDIETAGEDCILATLLEIKRKVLKSVLVKIEVASHAEAYMLFESLNNRGAALTAIDLMKNTILAKAESFGMSTADVFDIWQELLGYISDDYGVQERFFRQYYNAFKNDINRPFWEDDGKKRDVLGNVATRSNLLTIYETLISKDLPGFLDDIIDAGKIYAKFLLRDEEDGVFKDELASLYHVQAAPAYVLLLYLFRWQEDLKLSDEHLKGIIHLLTVFFVRRNLTDIPGTRDTTRILMDIIAEIEESGISGADILTTTYNALKERSASDDIFEKMLKGNIYEDNVGVTRFILCELAEKNMTSEKFTDLWEQIVSGSKKRFKWTIEHIFPEGENIPSDWVKMIADGDPEKAKQYREEYVHKLGNLTMTVYNSSLSNMDFIRKRDRTADGKYIGYKNGLEINTDIAKKEAWTVEDITARTEKLVKEVLALFAF